MDEMAMDGDKPRGYLAKDIHSILSEEREDIVRAEIAYRCLREQTLAEFRWDEHMKNHGTFDTSGDDERQPLVEAGRVLRLALYRLGNLMTNDAGPGHLMGYFAEEKIEIEEDQLDRILERAAVCAIRLRGVDRTEPEQEPAAERALMAYRWIEPQRVPSKAWVELTVLEIVKFETLLKDVVLLGKKDE
jgi:hypothetical protein